MALQGKKTKNYPRKRTVGERGPEGKGGEKGRAEEIGLWVKRRRGKAVTESRSLRGGSGRKRGEKSSKRKTSMGLLRWRKGESMKKDKKRKGERGRGRMEEESKKTGGARKRGGGKSNGLGVLTS